MEAEEVVSAQTKVMQNFCTGAITLKNAAAELTTISLFRDTSPEAGLNRLWSVVLEIARGSCRDHSKLVEILAYLSELPPPRSTEDKPFVLYDQLIWRDLPMLDWELRDEWNVRPHPGTPFHRRHQADCNFVNINRFVANLMTTEKEVFDYSWFVLVTFRETLETVQPLDLLSAYIPAAAAWIEILGVEIFEWDEELPSGCQDASGEGGPLWGGKNGFCKDRWKFWKERLSQFTTENCITVEARNVAGEAFQMMEEVELGHLA